MSRHIAALLLFQALSCSAATSVATVGDRFADAISYGMRSRPDLLRQNNIQLVRWRRPAIGLTRIDQFDYPVWLQQSADLGTADFCVVQIGANDRQSFPAGPGKWVLFPTETWQVQYRGRVQTILQTLHTSRCRRVIWVLQPGFENSKFLARYQQMMNALQVSGSGWDGTLFFEIDARPADYGPDHIHFTGPFTLKLADSIFRVVAEWTEHVPASCFGCHTTIHMKPPMQPSDLLPLRVHTGSAIRESVTLLAHGVAPRSFVPPPFKIRTAHVRPRLIARRRHTRRA